MTEKIKQANTQAKEILQFAKQMLQILFTLSILGLGIYAIALGKLDTDTLIKQIALVVSGVCTLLAATGQLYKIVMRK